MSRAFLDLLRDGPLEAIRAALAHDPRLASARDEVTGEWALEVAILGRDDASVIAALLDAGAALTDCNPLIPRTPVFAFVRSIAVAELLDRRGAPWSEHGDAALSLAAGRGDPRLVAWLMDHGARPGAPALRSARGRTRELLPRLLAAVAPEARDQALRDAVIDDDEDAVRELLGAGASARSPGLLVLSTSAAIVEALLHAGADARAADEHGELPIIAAAYEGAADVVALLMRFGADPDATNRHGQCARDVDDPVVRGLLSRA